MSAHRQAHAIYLVSSRTQIYIGKTMRRYREQMGHREASEKT